MQSVSITYTVHWQIGTHPHYVFDRQGNCYNLRTSKKLSRTVKNGMVGYYIQSKFMSLSKIKPLMQKIKPQPTPF